MELEIPATHIPGFFIPTPTSQTEDPTEDSMLRILHRNSKIFIPILRDCHFSFSIPQRFFIPSASHSREKNSCPKRDPERSAPIQKANRPNRTKLQNVRIAPPEQLQTFRSPKLTHPSRRSEQIVLLRKLVLNPPVRIALKFSENNFH